LSSNHDSVHITLKTPQNTSGVLPTNSKMIIVDTVKYNERTNNSTFQKTDIFVDDGQELNKTNHLNNF